MLCIRLYNCRKLCNFSSEVTLHFIDMFVLYIKLLLHIQRKEYGHRSLGNRRYSDFPFWRQLLWNLMFVLYMYAFFVRLGCIHILTFVYTLPLVSLLHFFSYTQTGEQSGLFWLKLNTKCLYLSRLKSRVQNKQCDN